MRAEVAIVCELVVKSKFFNILWIYVPLFRPIPKDIHLAQ